MIPAIIETHLRGKYGAYQHHTHASAATAQELAAAEHVSGSRVAKLVVLRLDGELAIAVIAATDRVNVHPLEEATGARAELARETEFAGRFLPCEIGAEPPLAMFGIPIYVDDKLIREHTIVIPAGTHEDAAIVDTSEWIWCERVQPLVNLGVRAARGARRVFACIAAGHAEGPGPWGPDVPEQGRARRWSRTRGSRRQKSVPHAGPSRVVRRGRWSSCGPCRSAVEIWTGELRQLSPTRRSGASCRSSHTGPSCRRPSPPAPIGPATASAEGAVVAHPVLGGLHHDYHGAA